MASGDVLGLHVGDPRGAPLLAGVAMDLPVVQLQDLDGEVGLELHHLLLAAWALACPPHCSHGGPSLRIHWRSARRINGICSKAAIVIVTFIRNVASI